MNTDIRLKIKIGVLLILTIVTYILGSSIIGSNIDKIRSQRSSIENINKNISILVLISNRIYVLDDRLTSNMMEGRNYEDEIKQICLFKDGFVDFVQADKNIVDSLINIKVKNVRQYEIDTVFCDDMGRYLSENMKINVEMRKILRRSILKSLDQNNDKLQTVLNDYDVDYRKFIFDGAILTFIFSLLGVLLVRDVTKLVRSNNRSKSTINDLLIYIKSLRN